MKLLEFQTRITKIIKKNYSTPESRNNENLIIPREYNETHEIHKIHFQNHEHHKN